MGEILTLIAVGTVAGFIGYRVGYYRGDLKGHAKGYMNCMDQMNNGRTWTRTRSHKSK